MFSDCSALTTILSLAFRNYFASDTMFYECTSSKELRTLRRNTDALMDNRERGYFSRH